MKRNLGNRLISSALAFVMVLGNVSVSSMATERDGLCDHHAWHTEECGYSAVVEAQACGHEHTDVCYTAVTECIHVHGDCGYVPAVEGHGCECQPSENGENVHSEGCGYVEAVKEVLCDHVCSKKNGCIKQVLNCKHTHDDTCGYIEGAEESPCAFVCEECAREAADQDDVDKESADKEAADAVAALIEALPTVDELRVMSKEEQSNVYNQVQQAYEAYDVLTDDQKALLPSSEEVFKTYFDFFNSLITVLWDGDGTANSPYLINNEADLRALAQSTNDGNTQANTYFSLTANIILTEEWIPIGTETSKFCGIFDGQNYTISGISGTGSYLGLFGYLGGGAQVQNVKVADVQLSGGPYLAGIAAIADHDNGQIIIKNCHAVGGTIQGDEEEYYAGIVGYAVNGTGIIIENCTNSVFINAGRNVNWAGGIAAYLTHAAVTSCVNYANVSGNGVSEDNGSSWLGGICGQANASSFTGCANYGKITTFFAAGIAGGSGNSYSSCLNGGVLNHSSDGFGDPIGRIQNNSFQNCYFSKVGYQGGWLWDDPSKTGAKVSELSSGSVAYALRDYFGQIIGTDPYPVLLTDENRVHKVTITGDLVKTLYVNHNKSMNLKLDNPKMELYHDDNLFDLETPITGDITLIAKTTDLCASGTCGAYGDNLTWILTDDGTLTISGSGEMENYDSIEPSWMMQNVKVNAVVLPTGLTTIGNNAFANCEELTTISIPDGVIRIGTGAFCNCSSLTEVIIPNSITTIEEAVFDSCCSLAEIMIPNAVTSIGVGAFHGCSSLTEISIPKSVTTIGAGAFNSCKSLSSVRLSDNVSFIGQSAFNICEKLADVYFEGTEESWKKITIEVENAPLINATIHFKDPCANGHNFGMDNVCTNCGAIGGTCGENLTWTLSDDGTLTISGTGPMVDYPWNISPPWYSWCDSVKKLILEDGITTIGDNAFKNFTNITSVNIPNGVTKIGNLAFGNCTSLSDVSIPETVTTIVLAAFSKCASLKSVTIPSYLDPIDEQMFSTCTSLQEIRVSTSSTGKTNLKTVDGVLLNLDGTLLVQYPAGKVGSYIIPDGVKRLYCGAFDGSLNLSSVTIPDTVTCIDMAVFLDCINLGEIIFSGNAPKIFDDSFYGVSATAYYPAGNKTWSSDVLQGYGGAITWVPYNPNPDIVASGICGAQGDNLTWTLNENGELTISGSGEMENYQYDDWAPWYDYRDSITSVDIADGVQTIGSYAFWFFEKMESVVIPESVISIGNVAFFNCNNLNELTLPSKLVTIGRSAFYTCSKLKHILIPETVTTIGDHAFRECYGLEDIFIPKGVTSIGGAAFASCSKLSEISLDADNANYTVVDGVLFSKDMTVMLAYPGGKPDASYTIPDSVTKIEKAIFDDSINLNTLFIPKSVTEIGYGVFNCFQVIHDIYYDGSEYEWNQINIDDCNFELDSITIHYSNTCSNGHQYGADHVCTICGAIGGTHGDNVTWSINEETGTLTVSGTGTIKKEFAGNMMPWYQWNEKITAVVVESGISEIPSYVFEYLESVKTITLPDSLTALALNAFNDCGSLNNLLLPASLSTINGTSNSGHPEFIRCESLTDVYYLGTEAEWLSIPNAEYVKNNYASMTMHFLELHESPASCTDSGKQPYYMFDNTSVYSSMYDMQKNVITELEETPALGHTEEIISGKSATCTETGLTEGKHCSVCGTVLVEQEVILAKGHNYDKGTCTECGETDPEYVKPTEPESGVSYSQVSLSLAGDIGINYYVQLSDDILADEGSYMAFTVAGKTQRVHIQEALVDTDKDGNTTYRFSCKVAAKQMTDTVVGQMYTSNGPVGEEKAYSVKAYCDAAIPAYSQNEAYASLIDLMKAMLNYGAYSQIQFDYHTDNLANADLENTSLPKLTADDLAAYAHGATGREEGIRISTVSLLLESTTTIRFYFKLDGTKSIEEYTFYVDGVEVEPVFYEDNTYYVDKGNVAAKDLDKMATVTVGGLTVQYCGLSYVRQVAVLYPDHYSESLINVGKALYVYNQCANTYFG